MEKVKMSARACAYKILYKIENENSFSNMALKEGLSGCALEGADRRLVASIVYGCVKYKRYLDYIISQFSSVKIKKLSLNVLILLRMGAYQIVKLNRVPDSAAVNESVKLAQKYAYRSKAFINAVLRKISDQKDSIKMPDDLKERLKVECSFPDEIADMLLAEHGAENAGSLMRALNENAPLTVRVNTLKTDKESLAKILLDEGVTAKECGVDNMLVLEGISDIASLESYKKGLFTPQGIGSYFASYILSPKKGECVIDVCAAPGGKSTHIAEIMENKGVIHSFDIHSHRAALIESSAKRLGIDIIKTKVADSSQFMCEYESIADCVLADVVCSGLGVIRKKPDIKWSFDTDKLDELASLQYKILSSASRYVKKGGSLVYSTCTITKQENMDVVERFLKENDEFEPCAFDEMLPEKYVKPSAKEGYIQFYPHTDSVDGFFIYKLRRKS
ncbi:MAG: 16S rRNA (cytosine(967)-C(5))-methyltransferase RsmB [Ruminococcaceae bacterium]|nr:16S rRNA (cytosine(967)-C(5))-methyltransferase RsmB [Oscillospiraceae bacterium]